MPGISYCRIGRQGTSARPPLDVRFDDIVCEFNIVLFCDVFTKINLYCCLPCKTTKKYSIVLNCQTVPFLVCVYDHLDSRSKYDGLELGRRYVLDEGFVLIFHEVEPGFVHGVVQFNIKQRLFIPWLSDHHSS